MGRSVGCEEEAEAEAEAEAQVEAEAEAEEEDNGDCGATGERSQLSSESPSVRDELRPRTPTIPGCECAEVGDAGSTAGFVFTRRRGAAAGEAT
jgi:hypothetical protein